MLTEVYKIGIFFGIIRILRKFAQKAADVCAFTHVRGFQSPAISHTRQNAAHHETVQIPACPRTFFSPHTRAHARAPSGRVSGGFAAARVMLRITRACALGLYRVIIIFTVHGNIRIKPFLNFCFAFPLEILLIDIELSALRNRYSLKRIEIRLLVDALISRENQK